ncbi:MAG: hypothetical protein HS129_05560 [Leptospiraceae bacterium]|nr:hypothetical protein [Leptospiraceae bacterium]
MIDEESLGIEHKKREYSITELQSKKQESLNQIYSYYNNLELKIATTPDEQLHTLRINMVNAIFMHDRIKEYCKGDSNFPGRSFWIKSVLA